MATIQINSEIKIGLEELLNGLAKLGNKDFDKFIREVNLLNAKRQVPNLSRREAELLVAINHFWSEEKTTQYLNLQQKMQEETISEDEYQTYMKLVEESEQRSLERVKNLAELAKIRGISLPQLMKQMNLTTHPLNYA